MALSQDILMVLMEPKGEKAPLTASSPSSKLILPMYILERERGEKGREGREGERGERRGERGNFLKSIDKTEKVQ